MLFIHGLFSKGCYHLAISTSDGHFQHDHRNNGNISIQIPIFKRRLEIAASQISWVSLTHISNGLLIRVYKHKTTPFLPAQIFNLTNSLFFFFSFSFQTNCTHDYVSLQSLHQHFNSTSAWASSGRSQREGGAKMSWAANFPGMELPSPHIHFLQRTAYHKPLVLEQAPPGKYMT